MISKGFTSSILETSSQALLSHKVNNIDDIKDKMKVNIERANFNPTENLLKIYQVHIAFKNQFLKL